MTTEDRPLDAPDADAQEQHSEVQPPEGSPPSITDDPEAPEADALEQATPAPVEEEGYER